MLKIILMAVVPIDKALELYQTVINKLSKEALENLNHKLLTEAQKNFQKNNKELAATAYRQLFADFIY